VLDVLKHVGVCDSPHEVEVVRIEIDADDQAAQAPIQAQTRPSQVCCIILVGIKEVRAEHKRIDIPESPLRDVRYLRTRTQEGPERLVKEVALYPWRTVSYLQRARLSESPLHDFTHDFC